MYAGRNSANARYHKVLAALSLIVKAREDKRYKLAHTLVKMIEIFENNWKVIAPKHPPNLAKLWAKIASLTNDLEVKEVELQTLPGLVDKEVRLGE